jgi:hypothetical protein
VRGESQQDGNLSPPPPPKWRVKSGGSPTWGPVKMTRQDPPRPATTRHDPPCHLSHDPGRGKKGATLHFSKCSLIKDYFKKLISHNRCAMLPPSLLKCQSLPISFLQAVRREIVSYIVTQAYKRPAKTTRHSQSATLHSTGNISVEGSENKNKAGHNSIRETVSSLLFFRRKYCCTQSTCSTSLCGLRL